MDKLLKALRSIRPRQMVIHKNTVVEKDLNHHLLCTSVRFANMGTTIVWIDGEALTPLDTLEFEAGWPNYIDHKFPIIFGEVDLYAAISDADMDPRLTRGNKLVERYTTHGSDETERNYNTIFKD